jgi:hypothetical protein
MIDHIWEKILPEKLRSTLKAQLGNQYKGATEYIMRDEFQAWFIAPAFQVGALEPPGKLTDFVLRLLLTGDRVPAFLGLRPFCRWHNDFSQSLKQEVRVNCG